MSTTLRNKKSKASPDFPKRPGNLFTLLVDGHVFFPRMSEVIASARHHIFMEMYLVESGAITTGFVNEFLEAAERGVEVQLLLDDFGARGLSRVDRKRLTDGGVQLVFYNPLRLLKMTSNLFRTHRKLLIVDDEIAFVGGAGLADEFSGENAWRETMVEIRGPIVVDWHDVFASTWAQCSGASAATATPHQNRAGDMDGRVACTHPELHTEIKRVFLTRVARSRERIWLTTAYFIPSRKVRRALRRAARRGVDVRIILPGSITDHPAIRQASRRFYARLLRYGVRIFEYQECFMHSKVVLVDDWCSIGSSNMDRWGFRWNLEANQEVESHEFIETLLSMLSTDLERCEEVDSDTWRQRSRTARVKERFWGQIDLWLARWKP